MKIRHELKFASRPSESKLDSIRRIAKSYASELNQNLGVRDTFAKNPRKEIIKSGLETQNLTRRSPDACYQCNTTTCGGVTCGKTC